MTRSHVLGLSSLALALATLAPAATAQRSAANSSQLQVVQSRIPRVPLDSLPELPAFTTTSPRTTILFADRAVVAPASGSLPLSSAVLVDHTIPGTDTGTTKQEVIQYQLPSAPSESPYPLVVAYHGFGSSAASVASQTGLDEACDANGWAYLSVTGLDDKLFGTPLCQQNVDAAIEWMLANSDADPDRIYMVGFSMGGGVVTNYAARHRDPDGIMVAAVATVSGSFDWGMGWTMDPGVQTWMLNAWNFGGSPSTETFAYRSASALWHDMSSYPPVPGTHLDTYAMANNLASTPTYVTWDSNDTVTYLPDQSSAFVSLMTAAGGSVTTRTVSGTTNPADGSPATHSWAVMDLTEVMAFFDGKSVERWPESLQAQVEEDRTVGWLDVTQASAGDFTWVEAAHDVAGSQLQVSAATNAGALQVDLDAAGLAGVDPLRVLASSSDANAYSLRLTGLTSPPSYATETADGSHPADLEWDGETGSLILAVDAASSIDVQVHFADWGASMAISPDPVARGDDFSLTASARPGTSTLWLLLALTPGPMVVAGHTFYLSPLPPSVMIPLPLGTDGTLGFTTTMPDVPELAGARLLFQGAIVGSGSGLSEMTNPVGLDVL